MLSRPTRTLATSALALLSVAASSQQQDANTGDIVAAMVEDEVVCETDMMSAMVDR